MSGKMLVQSSFGIAIPTRSALVPAGLSRKITSISALPSYNGCCTLPQPSHPVQPALRLNSQRQSQITSRPQERTSIVCQSASSATSGSDGEGVNQTLVLGALFGAWYLFNIYFNIYNKQVLSVFPFPVTCTMLQFAIGTVVSVMLWTTGLLKKPQVTPQVLWSILPLAVVHCLGNLLTNCSLGAVAVSFTHTIKAMEPFFSVLLSWLFLAERPHPLVLATLFPIVGGVAAASLAEASFNWYGFTAAMGSNITFQSRNVLSKKLMVKKDGLDNINLFSIITVMAFFLLLPFTLLVDGLKCTPQGLESLGVSPAQMYPLMQKSLVAGLCFHMYQQVSYMILQRVSPVTHSIGNCVKRVVVIVASVLVFQNPMTIQTAVGTSIALLGVFAYSQAKRFTKPKAA